MAVIANGDLDAAAFDHPLRAGRSGLLAQGDIDSFLRPRPLRLGLTMLRYTQDLFLETP